MTRNLSFAWGAAVGMVVLLNVLDVLPDWTTIAAVLTMAGVSGLRCRPLREG